METERRVKGGERVRGRTRGDLEVEHIDVWNSVPIISDEGIESSFVCHLLKEMSSVVYI